MIIKKKIKQTTKKILKELFRKKKLEKKNLHGQMKTISLMSKTASFHACFKAPENLTTLLLSKKKKGKRELIWYMQSVGTSAN